MRSAGCVINDIFDRHVDHAVKRTAERPLASGMLSLSEAVCIFLILSAMGLGLLLCLNQLTIWLGIVGFCLAVLYPFSKRFIAVPQAVLGVTFAWAVPMSFAAVQGQLPAQAWWLYACNIAWVIAYDTQYARVDREDDVKIGILSSAVFLGHHDRWVIGLLQVLSLVLFIVAVGRAHLGVWLYGGVAAAALLFGYQAYLIRHRRPADCFRAFLNNHWVGAVLFISLLLSKL